MNLLPVLLAGVLLLAGSARASDLPAVASPVPEATETADVRAADDARVKAITTVDAQKLDEILADGLSYGHSNGQVDTKTSLIAALVDRRMVYERLGYRERIFERVAPGVVLMRGRVTASIRDGAKILPLDLRFLALWKREDGRWRFLAWQSARVAESTP